MTRYFCIPWLPLSGNRLQELSREVFSSLRDLWIAEVLPQLCSKSSSWFLKVLQCFEPRERQCTHMTSCDAQQLVLCESLYFNWIWMDIRRKFRSQTSDNLDRWKSRGEKSPGGEVRRSEKRKREKKEDAGARKGRKVAIHCVFPMICVALEGRKVRSLKRRVRSQLARWEIKECTALWREAHFQVKSAKKLTVSDHSWKLRCWKSAWRCGAKHISKSKVYKTDGLRPRLEVEMFKKCTPLWREAHFQVKMLKTPHARTTFGSWDIEKVHAVVARSTFPSQNGKDTRCSDHFWKLRCWKTARRCGAKHISKSKW